MYVWLIALVSVLHFIPLLGHSKSHQTIKRLSLNAFLGIVYALRSLVIICMLSGSIRRSWHRAVIDITVRITPPDREWMLRPGSAKHGE
jgi:hypothetical protein